MKLSIKTLKGEIFHIQADGEENVGKLKEKIQAERAELVADRQKLIHAGKVLKDEQTVTELGLSESDFLVCMVTKEVAKKPTPTATAAPTTTSQAPAAATTTPVAAPTQTAPPTQPVVASTTTSTSAVPGVNISNESVQALVSMGFPESESRAALTAAMGNPDLAYEFLLTGIPPQMQQFANTAAAQAPAATSNATSGQVSIESLRQHPQFNMLKQLVQQNPAALSQVLDLIGSQNPALLAAIHANNEAFIAMMNEPITDTPPAAPAVTSPPRPAAPTAGASPFGANQPSPADVMGLLAALPPAQRAQLAQSMGLNPQQLEATLQLMASMPPDQLQQMMGAMGMGGLGGMGGMERDPPGVVRLTEEEMAAVNRLMALGFSQQQAAQAYLACDKNEEQAANLLFDGGFEDDDGMDFGDDEH